MKILIADSFPEAYQAELINNGHQIAAHPALQGDTLTEAIDDHEILIVRSTEVDANTLAAGKSLKLVIRAGAGTNTINKAYAAENGIRVCNVPGANAMAVAELAIGLIICLDRNIPNNNGDLKNKVWAKKKYSNSQGLYGQKLGILGLGAIGLAVAERANAFGIRVHAVAKTGRSAEAEKRINDVGIKQLESVDALLATCDIISLHLPVTAETNKMVNKTFLAKMKERAMLINTSRGDLVDEAALIEAIETKGIRVGLDVYDNEPAAGDNHFDSAIATHPGVCGTHHIGASTEQAQMAVADGVLQVIQSYAQGNLRNCVN